LAQMFADRVLYLHCMVKIRKDLRDEYIKHLPRIEWNFENKVFDTIIWT
jgi:hypothetical protein